MNSIDKKLINFRCDLDVLDMFDEVADFKRMNRSQVLIDLIHYVLIHRKMFYSKLNIIFLPEQLLRKDLDHV